MQVKLVWSESRQMFVGKAVKRQSSSVKLISGLLRWLQPTTATQRRPQTSRVWQSALMR